MKKKEVTLTIGIYSNNQEVITSIKRALYFLLSDDKLYFYSFFENDIEEKVKNVLKKYGRKTGHLIICLLPLHSFSSNIIALVHKVRNMDWEGSFLAIVNSENQKKELEGFDLFGLNEYKEGDIFFKYIQVDGHDVISIPFDLHKFLNKIKNRTDMYLEIWRDIKNSSVYWNSLNKIDELDENNRVDILKTLKDLNRINWSIFVPHPQDSSVKNLLADYDTQNGGYIIKKLKELKYLATR